MLVNSNTKKQRFFPYNWEFEKKINTAFAVKCISEADHEVVHQSTFIKVRFCCSLYFDMRNSYHVSYHLRQCNWDLLLIRFLLNKAFHKSGFAALLHSFSKKCFLRNHFQVQLTDSGNSAVKFLSLQYNPKAIPRMFHELFFSPIFISMRHL